MQRKHEHKPHETENINNSLNHIIMNFEIIILVLKQGGPVRRSSWPKDQFVFRQVPATISKDIVPKMQSLPDSVKAEFARRFEDESYQIDAIYYDNQLALVSPSNLIQSYSPSVEDLMADDWVLLEHVLYEELPED